MASLTSARSLRSSLMYTASVASLFAAGEIGVWFDPTDITTLFQDNAGTTPVTAAGQPVGLMLDKSKGLALGSELVINGTFADGTTTGWTSGSAVSTAAVVSGEMQVTAVSASGRQVTSISTVIGKTYIVTGIGRLISGSGGLTGAALYQTGVTGTTITSGTINSTGSNAPLGLIFTATATTSYVSAITLGNTGSVAAFDNISVKELAGNHATQPTAAQRPTYGVIPYGGVRNFTAYSSDLSQASWLKGSECSISNGGQLTPNGNTAWLATFSGVTSNAVVYDTGHTVLVGQVVTFSGWLKAGTAPSVFLRIANGDGTTLQAASITPTATWTRFSLTATITVAGANSFGQVRGSTTTAGTVLIGDFQYEYSASQTPFQKTVTKYNTTEAGKATVGALFTDGIDDFMVTPSIDFSGTDKVTVWAGVEKLSDAVRGAVVELGAGLGSAVFGLFAPSAALSGYAFSSYGSLQSIPVVTGFPSPVVSVLTGIGDISGDRATLQVNGTQVAQSTADQGTGNYSNNPIYLFRRGGASLPFNGIFTGLIVRGAASSESQISLGNGALNAKLGAY